jgi:cytochrome c-type biogenesis protein CcmE
MSDIDPKPNEDRTSSPGMTVPAHRRRRDGDGEPGGASSRVRLAIVLGLGAVAVGIVGLVFAGMQDSAIYSKPVDELVANKSKFAGRPVRAEGNLVHGSLQRRDQPCEYRFVITKNGVDLPVRFPQCVVPDTFRDVPGMDVGVTVEGELQADNSFEATSVLAKCPSKYEMKQRQDNGEKMPHAMNDQGM